MRIYAWQAQTLPLRRDTIPLNYTYLLMRRQVTVTLDEEVLEEIDEMRGLAPRSAQINELLKRALEG